MGSPVGETWTGFEGAYYVGAGSGEVIWTLISAALCVLAIVLGAAHELRSYRK